MKIALITDIHANREAFEACLEDAERRGAQSHALLGDFVGYGADPGWVADKAAAMVADGAVAVRGNHDDAAVRGAHPSMIEAARLVAQWTHEQLDAQQRAFLEALPDSIEADSRLYVHANAVAPRAWGYVTSRLDAAHSMHATRCRATFCGHIHAPRLYHLSASGRAAEFIPVADVPIPLTVPHQWLVLPGSAGQPRDGNPAACWAMFDTEASVLTYHRVPYDHERAAAKIVAAGLPAALAQRLRDGV